MANNHSEKIEYSRHLYQNVLDWYDNADSKAQVVLAIDGGLVAFISSTTFSKPDDIKLIINAATPVTFWLLAAMVISLMVSMGAAIYCLWARIYSAKKLKKIIDKAISKAQVSEFGNAPYPPSISCFFQFIERLDKDKFRETLNSINPNFEIKALANQIHILSKNVRKKHFAVNIGFVFSLTALVLFFLSSISYVFTLV